MDKARKQYEKDFDKLIKWIGQYNEMYRIISEQFGKVLKGFPEFDDMLAFMSIVNSVTEYPFDFTSENCDIIEQHNDEKGKYMSQEAKEGLLIFCQMLANSIAYRDDIYN